MAKPNSTIDVNHDPKNILLVDDRLDNLHLLRSVLVDQGYEVRRVINGQMALMGAEAEPPDLILLDINMPDMDGYEVCRKLKANPKTADIPVLFISALDDTLDKVKAFEVGGVDYVTKPFQVEEVLARVETHLNLRNLQQRLQHLNSELEQRVRQRTSELENANQALLEEVSERKQAQEKLWHLAWHDPLTNLLNRSSLMDSLRRSLQQVQNDPTFQFAMLFIDCDRFKTVNDSLGHLVGDQVLVAIAQRLEACLSIPHSLARLGGDEFALLINPCQDPSLVMQLAETLQAALCQPIVIRDHEIFISASIGIVFSSNSYNYPEELLRDADTAMYQAKAQGKARYEVFSPTMHDQVVKSLKLETDLRRALEQQEFLLFYQPIVCLKTGQIQSFEALVRWHHPHQGLVSPGDFIPIAEETGLIIPLGAWVLEEACGQLCQWQQQFQNHPAAHRLINTDALSISVNLSVRQFSQTSLIQILDQILDRTGLESRYLKLEITESAIMDHVGNAEVTLNQLKERQIHLSIDDFGTGYSSLSYLHRFPVDTVKIDRSFVNRISPTGENLEIVRAIAVLSHSLGMSVIAEGVETDYHQAFLRELGCEFGQGYRFAKPLDPSAAQQLLQANWDQLIQSDPIG